MKKLVVLSSMVLSLASFAQPVHRMDDRPIVNAQHDRLHGLERQLMDQRREIDRDVDQHKIDRRRADMRYRQNDNLTRQVKQLERRGNARPQDIDRIEHQIAGTHR